jgi:predicted Fe-Mo cluster-binding NifX family protein
MRLRFALAVDNDNQLGNNHFGDADRFLIYTMEDEKMILSSEEVNDFKLNDTELDKGSIPKGNAMINFLKEKKVHVLVSERFCHNVNLLSKHFIPVEIMREHLDEFMDHLCKHLHWIEDEWANHSTGFSLFTISTGILKTSIDIKNAENSTI